MNVFTRLSLIGLLACLGFSCSSLSPDDLDIEKPGGGQVEEEPKEIKLSVSQTNEAWLTTENVDFEFDILDGNGGYTATASSTGSDPDAKVTIKENRVTVNILRGYGAEVRITDQKSKEARVFIQSTHPSLQLVNYNWGMDVGQTIILRRIDFGVGAPYEIEKVKGDAAEVFKEGDVMKARSFKLGKTDYKFRDRRGTVAYISIISQLSLEMNQSDKTLRIDALNYMPASIKINWGTKWEIESYTSHVIEKPSVSQALIPSGGLTDHYYLSVLTDEKAKGSDVITLKNEAGEVITVEVVVK